MLRSAKKNDKLTLTFLFQLFTKTYLLVLALADEYKGVSGQFVYEDKRVQQKGIK